MKLVVGILWICTLIMLPILWLFGVPALLVTIIITVWVNKIIKESGDSSIQGFIAYIKQKYYSKKKD